MLQGKIYFDFYIDLLIMALRGILSFVAVGALKVGLVGVANGSCMAIVWQLYGSCMAVAWQLHGSCMAIAWHFVF